MSIIFRANHPSVIQLEALTLRSTNSQRLDGVQLAADHLAQTFTVGRHFQPVAQIVIADLELDLPGALVE